MNNVSSLLGVIFAGGQSRRMDGIDKYGISVGGKTLINHISERLSPQVTNLIILQGYSDPELRIRISLKDLKLCLIKKVILAPLAVFIQP